MPGAPRHLLAGGLLFAFLSTLGCATQKAATPPAPALLTGPPPTTSSVTLTLPKSGTVVTVRRTTERDDYEQPAPPSLLSGGPNDGVTYRGSDRKAAKLSLTGADLEEYESVQELLDTLPDDSAMIARNPPISRSKNSRRVEEEKRNIAVAGYLAAAAKENDNDYHVILCDDPDVSQPVCINVEVSGLPVSGIYRAPLQAARAQFEALLGNNPPGSGYDFYNTQIPVVVTGSLFYDISHPPGAVGPSSLRPTTSWELHPVATLVEQ